MRGGFDSRRPHHLNVTEIEPLPMLALILIMSCILCLLAYRFYGAFLSTQCGLDDDIPTPAIQKQDGLDYAPTRASVLFGHHFSSIAGAGPIVGPILAATYFGWGPTWAWILIGAILVGGVHDFGSTLLSVRNEGRSIADSMCGLIGRKVGQIFMLFVIFALVYVIIVFLDLTANTFVRQPEVATASGWFVVVALLFGILLRTEKFSLSLLALFFFPLTFAGLAIGHHFPMVELSKDLWLIIVLAYCFIASVLPIGTLLQPRDFLSAGFLYAILVLGLIGMLFTNESIQIPAFEGWESEKLGMLVPFLFISVACGACSGFHSIVSSGTTSKQIRKETDVRRISYGGMLVEAILAVFAMGCVMALTPVEREVGNTPVGIFASGAAKFFGTLGIPLKLGTEFAMLAVSTFLLTTLDTCTRLTRFLLEELFSWQGGSSRFLGTIFALALPTILVFQKFPDAHGSLQPAWKAIWPLFGATNQLLAALALMTFLVFLKNSKINFSFVIFPAMLMTLMPMYALIIMVSQYGPTTLLGGTSLVMLLLGVFLVYNSWKFLRTEGAQNP